MNKLQLQHQYKERICNNNTLPKDSQNYEWLDTTSYVCFSYKILPAQQKHVVKQGTKRALGDTHPSCFPPYSCGSSELWTLEQLMMRAIPGYLVTPPAQSRLIPGLKSGPALGPAKVAQGTNIYVIFKGTRTKPNMGSCEITGRGWTLHSMFWPKVNQFLGQTNVMEFITW